MRLLEESWIPTTEGSQTPSAALASASSIRWGRGDWDAATHVMLIGLLQSSIIKQPELCRDEEAWESLLHSPPGAHVLDTWFQPFREHFSGRSFEDYAGFDDGKSAPVAALLPESPGDNTMKKASDIVQWQSNTVHSLSEDEARIALYSDALWGMRWGSGHRQGPRGESRTTTLVEPEDGGTLWRQVWLNVLPYARWVARFGKSEWNDALIFPWTAPYRETASPRDSHPLTVYWAMPRRVRLNEPRNGVVSGLVRKNKGTEYIGWRHPLSPYSQTKVGIFALRLAPGHIGFDMWAGIALMEWNNVIPATVVSEFVERRWTGGALRVRVCGWALGSAGEAAAWVDKTVPLLVEADTETVEQLLTEAEERRKRLQRALKKVLPTHAKSYTDQLYSRAEPEFYERVRRKETDGWDRSLRRQALRLFDEATDAYQCDPFAVAQARVKV